jgi:WD repeat-containing protein 92
MAPEDGSPARDCWAVAFGNSTDDYDRCVVAGYDNGDIKMFDLRNMSLLWEANLPSGICGVEFDRKDIAMNKLLVTGLESALHVFDLRTQHPSKGFTGKRERVRALRWAVALGYSSYVLSVASQVTAGGELTTVWWGHHLPQNRDVFMTSGGSGTLNLWK